MRKNLQHQVRRQTPHPWTHREVQRTRPPRRSSGPDPSCVVSRSAVHRRAQVGRGVENVTLVERATGRDLAEVRGDADGQSKGERVEIRVKLAELEDPISVFCSALATVILRYRRLAPIN